MDADFDAFSTTLDFAEGETQKFILVRLIDDLVQQPPLMARTFDLELVNATGAPISTEHDTAQVTLYDDDVTYGAPDAGPAAFTARINPGGAPGETGLLNCSADGNGNATFSGTLRGRRFSGRCPEGDLDFIGDPKTLNIAGIGAVQLRLLRFNTLGNLPRILGTLTLPDSTELPIRGIRSHAQRDGLPATSKRGAYTLLLDCGVMAPADAPLGSGFARVKVLASGNVIIVGRLADGPPFSAGGTLNELRDLPLLVLLKKARGELSGVLRFRAIPGQSDIDGELRWFRPDATRPGLFSDDFTTTLAGSGARYVPPSAGEYALSSLATSNGAAIFHAESPDLAAMLDRQVTIGAAPKNVVTPPSPNVEKLRIKLNRTTGLWSGSFVEAGRTLIFQGALQQLANRAAGHFLGATQSGRVTLVPGVIDM